MPARKERPKSPGPNTLNDRVFVVSTAVTPVAISAIDEMAALNARFDKDVSMTVADFMALSRAILTKVAESRPGGTDGMDQETMWNIGDLMISAARHQIESQQVQ